MSHSHSSRLRRPRAAVGKCCLAVCLLGTFAFAQDILLALAEVPGMPALPRAQARLLRGEWTLAAQLADAGLSSDAINAPLRAAKVRALAALKDFSAAETELALLRASHNLSAIALAAVAISIERGDAADKKDAALGPLMGRPAEEWRPLLPVIAHQRTDRIKTSLNGRSTGLVTLNPLMIGLALLAFLAALAWAIAVSLRGTIVVRVQWDSDAKDELFSILVSRSPHTPSIDNLTAYRKKNGRDRQAQAAL